jgi:hypothetical protein
MFTRPKAMEPFQIDFIPNNISKLAGAIRPQRRAKKA